MKDHPHATVVHEEIQDVCDLFIKELNSFWVRYDFASEMFQISPIKEAYISVPWNAHEICQGNYDNIVFRPDVPLLQNFLDFKTIRPKEDKRIIQLRLFTDEHNYAWFQLVMHFFYRVDGQLDHVYILFTDIDEKIRLKRKLQFASSSDALTHFPNITEFQCRLQQMLKENPQFHYQIIHFDIDHFRSINAIFGSKEGDNLLKYLAVKIQEHLEREDLVAYSRIASDNFVVCLPQEYYQADEFVEFLQWAISAYPKNFDVNLSMGIYLVTEEDLQQNTPINVLTDRAASAHSSVKGNYLTRIGYYNDKIRQQENIEMLVTSEMNHALLTDQFVVYFQPKIEMDTGVIVGSEALVRWAHPTRGLIPPMDFIPIFERNGFILELDGYVIRRTCSYIRKWLDEGRTVLPVSVNLSRANLYNSRLLEQIDSYIEEFHIPQGLIEFELLESSFVTDNYNLAKLMQKLQERKFKILMDDFGHGYSALNALTSLPVDVIKIDRGFLPDDRKSKDAILVLKYIVEMIKGLGLEIVVEGVETKEQEEYLLEIGCRVVQGFYYHKPMPVEEFENLLASDIQKHKGETPCKT